MCIQSKIVSTQTYLQSDFFSDDFTITVFSDPAGWYTKVDQVLSGLVDRWHRTPTSLLEAISRVNQGQYGGQDPMARSQKMYTLILYALLKGMTTERLRQSGVDIQDFIQKAKLFPQARWEHRASKHTDYRFRRFDGLDRMYNYLRRRGQGKHPIGKGTYGKVKPIRGVDRGPLVGKRGILSSLELALCWYREWQILRESADTIGVVDAFQHRKGGHVHVVLVEIRAQNDLFKEINRLLEIPNYSSCVRIIGLMEQAARNLSKFHHTYVHGDYRYDNVVLKAGKLSIIDVAYACHRTEQVVYSIYGVEPGMVGGGCPAPELLSYRQGASKDFPVVDQKTDVFSFGIALINVLATIEGYRDVSEAIKAYYSKSLPITLGEIQAISRAWISKKGQQQVLIIPDAAFDAIASSIAENRDERPDMEPLANHLSTLSVSRSTCVLL